MTGQGSEVILVYTIGGEEGDEDEQAWFMQQFRCLLVMERDDELCLAMGTPRAWLQAGKYLRVRNAPTFFWPVSYAIESEADEGRIRARVELLSRNLPGAVLLRLRHPQARRLKAVEINGRPWKDFDPGKEIIRLPGTKGGLRIVAQYGSPAAGKAEGGRQTRHVHPCQVEKPA